MPRRDIQAEDAAYHEALRAREVERTYLDEFDSLFDSIPESPAQLASDCFPGQRITFPPIVKGPNEYGYPCEIDGRSIGQSEHEQIHSKLMELLMRIVVWCRARIDLPRMIDDQIKIRKKAEPRHSEHPPQNRSPVRFLNIMRDAASGESEADVLASLHECSAQTPVKGFLEGLRQQINKACFGATQPGQSVEAGEVVIPKAQHSKIVLPIDPDLAELINVVNSSDPKSVNVSDLCRVIAAKTACNAGSLRTAFFRWKKQNPGGT